MAKGLPSSDRTHHQQHHHHRRGRRGDEHTSESIARPVEQNEPLRGEAGPVSTTTTDEHRASDRFVCEIHRGQPAATRQSGTNRGRHQSEVVFRSRRRRRRQVSMMELISVNANRFMPFLLAVIVVASVKVELSVCDKLSQQTAAIKSSAAAPQSSAGINNRANNVATAAGAAAAPADSKERSLAMLSESIERQHHLKMPKLSNLILRPHHERPSKFDSGDDSSGGGSGSNIQEPNSISTSESRGSSLFHTTTGSNNKSTSNSSSSQSAKKSDDILRDIMRMHEQQQQQQQYHSSKKRPLIGGGGGGGQSHQLITSKLAAPSEVAQEHGDEETPRKNQQASSISRLKSMLGPNKLVAQLLSYITPLIGGKLAQNHQGVLPLAGAATAAAAANGSALFRTNPFTGRSHAIGSGLLLMNRKQQQPASASGATTAASETSFLGPPLWTISGNRLHTTDGPAYSYSPLHSASAAAAAAASSHGADSNRSSWISSKSQSSELSWDQLPNGDLMMTDSSSHLGSVSLAPFKLHSLKQQRGHTDRQSATKSANSADKKQSAKGELNHRVPHLGTWLKNSANQMAHGYIQDTFRGLLTLSQLPIAPLNSISTAPSVLEQKANTLKTQSNGATTAPPTSSSSSSAAAAAAAATTSTATINGLLSEKRTKALEDLYRYAYIVSTGMRRKRDPLKALASSKPAAAAAPSKSKFFTRQIAGKGPFTQRSIGQLAADNRNQMLKYIKSIQSLLARQASPRGVMWDMATDPTLAVTLFHLLERASVALPLGFLLYPFVQAIRNPLNGINLGRVLPPRALHRSVEHELLAKRLDVVDKVLSRALRPSHRESFIGR